MTLAQNDALLVSLVREHELWYNPTLNGYRNPHACASAWMQITKAMREPCVKVIGDIEIEVLQAKLKSRWKYLRIKHQKFIKNPDAFLHSSKLKLIKTLFFLKPHIDSEGNPGLLRAPCCRNSNQTERMAIHIKEERLPLKRVDASGPVNTSRIDPQQSPFGFFLSYLEAQMVLVDGAQQSQLQLDLLQTVLDYQKKAPILTVHVGENATPSPSSDDDPLG